MLRYCLVASSFAVVLLSACSGERGLSCEPAERYASARTAGPIRVPDDLSPPDESEAIVIPQASATELSGAIDPTRCLESPPEFFEEDAN